jgi:undecaprenyl-diphosphatase
MIFLNPVDTGIAEAFARWRSLGGAFFFINLSEIAGPTATAGLTLIVALILFLRRRFAAIAGLAIAVGGANAAWVIIKALIDRPRPPLRLASFLEPGSSFPSGHATNAFALATFFALLAYAHLPKGWARTMLMSLAFLLAALVAFGRVYLGVHYVSDVVAGALLGVLFGYLGSMAQANLERIARRLVRR